METLVLDRPLRTKENTVVVQPPPAAGLYVASVVMLDGAGNTVAAASLEITINDGNRPAGPG